MSASLTRFKALPVLLLMASMLLSPTAESLANPDQDLPGMQPPAYIKDKQKSEQENEIQEAKVNNTPDAGQAVTEPAASSSLPTIDPKIEGAGLYKKGDEGSLGPKLWDGASRSAVTILIDSMPVASQDPIMQKLIFGVLLSETQTNLMNNDSAPAPGHDLLSLRLKKLVEAGAYKQALEIYSGLEEEELPETAVNMGILSMLFSGQKSLACLEMNTLQGKYNASEFFKTIDAWCDATLSDSPSENSKNVLRDTPHKMLQTLAADSRTKKIKFPYAPAEFQKLSQMEQAVIVAEGALEIPQPGKNDFKNVPPAHIQALMKASNLSEKDQFILNVRAVEWGLMTQEEFEKTYIAALDPDIRLDPALSVPPKAEDWQALPYLLQLAKNKKNDAEKWPFIRQAFAAGNTYGLGALAPFAAILYKIRPDNASPAETMTVARVLHRGGYRLPGQWIDIIEKYAESDPRNPDLQTLRAAAFLSESDNNDNPQARHKILSALGLEDSVHSFFIKQIIENVDNGSEVTHNAHEIYEKGLDLTFQNDYVMPSSIMWDRLQKAGQTGNIGETVLLSIAVSRGVTPKDTYPGLLRDVLQSLKSVGLTDISENLALSAVLGSSV
ncbi:MAG: hypothetical protein IT558_00085 [Alphaproteobacteria bacterium]|nr:hypothetical protein [Alphaproteobacteria bacterium]